MSKGDAQPDVASAQSNAKSKTPIKRSVFLRSGGCRLETTQLRNFVIVVAIKQQLHRLIIHLAKFLQGVCIADLDHPASTSVQHNLHSMPSHVGY